MEAVTDSQPAAARLEVAGRHGLMRDEQIVQTARAGQADLVGGVEQRQAVIQQAARMVHGDGLQEGFGRQTGPAGEKLLQRGRLKAGLVGQMRQAMAGRGSRG